MITVHHLNNSRSQRVLWLLEELGLPYEIKRYQRDATTRLAPPDLTAVHPLGKSPVITDGGITIAESGAIVDYLIRTYGKGAMGSYASQLNTKQRWEVIAYIKAKQFPGGAAVDSSAAQPKADSAAVAAK